MTNEVINAYCPMLSSTTSSQFCTFAFPATQPSRARHHQIQTVAKDGPSGSPDVDHPSASPDAEHQNAPAGLGYIDGSDPTIPSTRTRPRCRKLPSGPCGLALWRSILHALHLGTILHQRPLYTLTDAVGFLPAVVNSDRNLA